MSKGYRKYSPEFREEVVKLVIDTSRAITDVAREYGVHDTTLGNWVREYKQKHGDATQEPLTLKGVRRGLISEARVGGQWKARFDDGLSAEV
jgi:transposase-like protein